MPADILAPTSATDQAPHPRFAVGVLAFCGVVVAVMQTIVVPLLPHIPALTGATPAAASRLVTVTLLTGAVFTPVAGATVVASGTAIAYSALPALVMRGVPVSETGAANGLNTLMRSIGQAFCSAAVAAVLADITFRVGGRTAPTLHAYQLVFLIAAGAAFAALLVTLFLPGGRTPATGTVDGHHDIPAGRKDGVRTMPIQEGA
ncbi:hypothetical protein ACWD4K_01825 [Streptomyces gelaticus]